MEGQDGREDVLYQLEMEAKKREQVVCYRDAEKIEGLNLEERKEQ